MAASDVLMWLELGELIRGNLQWIARLYLTSAELAPMATMTTPRQREYLAGRIAAKDAVRTWARQQGGAALHPAQLSIDTDVRGRPHVPPLSELPTNVHISISHSGTTAVALASDAPIGVDIEHRSRAEAVAAQAGHFVSDQDQTILAECWSHKSTPESMLRLWCAKEAAAKADGAGLQGRPHRFVLAGADNDGAMRIRNTVDQREFHVRTTNQNDMLIAIARCAE